MSRAHNDANMLVLGGWVTGTKVAEEIVRIWLDTPFDGGRHERRVKQIIEIERQMELARGKTYDITQTIQPGMLLWPGDQRVVFKKVEYEGIASLTQIDLSAHTGTHIDAPAHILSGGKGIDQFGMEQMTGIARVCHIWDVQCINRTVLSNINLEDVPRLLLRTNNSALLETSSFSRDYIALTQDAAEYLVEKNIRFVALDYLSVDEFDTSIFPAHRILMNAGVVIAEGVNLSEVPAGDYEMLCLPLKLKNCDGAPARIILRSI
jgi:arylformamidase